MMIVGIDGRLYAQTGVGTYIRNLIWELNQLCPENIHFNLYVLPEDVDKIRVNPATFTIKEAPFRWHTINEQTGFFDQLVKDSLDLMHFTYFGYPVRYRGKFVATIHDLTPLFFKTGRSSTKNPLIYEMKHFFFTRVLQTQIIHSQYIITPTHTVKNQLISYYGDEFRSKTIPIYEGVDRMLTETKERKPDSLPDFNGNFFLYVGNFYPHKNIQRLIQAMSFVDSNYSLVLVGPKDYFSRNITAFIHSVGMDERVYLYHPQNQGELIYFYKKAHALIHPSLSEGFGLPLVEAMYFDCPIIASSIPVFKELLRESYISFDPYSVSSISKSILQHLTVSHTNRKSYDKLHLFSFREMAKQTLALYRKALKE